MNLLTSIWQIIRRSIISFMFFHAISHAPKFLLDNRGHGSGAERKDSMLSIGLYPWNSSKTVRKAVWKTSLAEFVCLLPYIHVYPTEIYSTATAIMTVSTHRNIPYSFLLLAKRVVRCLSGVRDSPWKRKFGEFSPRRSKELPYSRRKNKRTMYSVPLLKVSPTGPTEHKLRIALRSELAPGGAAYNAHDVGS